MARSWAVAWSKEIEIAGGWGADPGAVREQVRSTVEDSWGDWIEYARPDGLERVFVSGGAARGGELSDALGVQIGLRVEELDPFKSVRLLNGSTALKVVEEHGSTLAVAAGSSLAALEDEG